jgi:hypothetical protein
MLRTLHKNQDKPGFKQVVRMSVKTHKFLKPNHVKTPQSVSRGQLTANPALKKVKAASALKFSVDFL